MTAWELLLIFKNLAQWAHGHSSWSYAAWSLLGSHPSPREPQKSKPAPRKRRSGLGGPGPSPYPPPPRLYVLLHLMMLRGVCRRTWVHL